MVKNKENKQIVTEELQLIQTRTRKIKIRIAIIAVVIFFIVIMILVAYLVVVKNSSTTSIPLRQPETMESSSNATSTPLVSPVFGEAPVPLEKALDQVFTSQKLGIALRYPSSAIVGECVDSVSVVAREKEYSVDFVAVSIPDEKCAYLPDGVLGEIYAQRATNTADVRRFIDRVFSPNCIITEESDYVENGDNFTMEHLDSKNPPKNEPDFECGESFRWNRSAGVVMFSSLGSKTGGGFEWNSSKMILMPDGSVEPAFDFPIMKSVQFLKP